VIDLLTGFCQYKSKKKAKRPDFLKKFLQFCVKTLVEFNQQQVQPDWRIKEAILYAIGSLYQDLYAYSELRRELEPMVKQFVLPELVSQQPFLQMRASWVYGEFGNFKFKEAGHMQQVVGAVFKQLYDPRLPVRITAATAVAKLLHNVEAE
jgi:hypothetical protein